MSVIPEVPQDIERTMESGKTEWSVAERSFPRFAADRLPSVGLPHTRGTMPLVGRVKFFVLLVGRFAASEKVSSPDTEVICKLTGCLPEPIAASWQWGSQRRFSGWILIC